MTLMDPQVDYAGKYNHYRHHHHHHCHHHNVCSCGYCYDCSRYIYYARPWQPWSPGPYWTLENNQTSIDVYQQPKTQIMNCSH